MVKHASRQPGNRKDRLWFNWPLALGLILNFVVLGLVASCIIHALR